MDYVQLGRSGMVVSRLSLGTMTFGWQVRSTEAHRILDAAVDLGINFFDTADVYGGAEPGQKSEEILGEWLAVNRSKVLVSTKFGRNTGSLIQRGGSRHNVRLSIQNSLRRLKTDYIDIAFLHEFDPLTPIEETLQTLDALVSDGVIRYIGCSNFDLYQLMCSLRTSDQRNFVRFIAAQARFNLAWQTASELAVACSQEGVGVLAYNPFAGGLLANSEPALPGSRLSSSAIYNKMYGSERHLLFRAEIERLANRNNVDLQTVALQWLLQRRGVASALVGVRTEEQLSSISRSYDRASPISEEEIEKVSIQYGITTHRLLTDHH
jgi:aryl-alcohol dehydrogenase (NADP+)